jgi:hypothetical protein
MTTQCSVAEYISRQVRRLRKYDDIEPAKGRNIRFFLMRWLDDRAPDYVEFQHSVHLMMDKTTEDVLHFTLTFRAAPHLTSLRYSVSVVPTFGGFYTRVEGDNTAEACRAVQVRMQRWLTSAVPDARAVEEIYLTREAA